MNLICMIDSILFWDYFEFIIKKHETIPDDPPLQIYTNETKNNIVFKRKTGRKLELLSPKTMKLLGSTKKKKKNVDQDKDGRGCAKLRICWSCFSEL